MSEILEPGRSTHSPTLVVESAWSLLASGMPEEALRYYRSEIGFASDDDWSRILYRLERFGTAEGRRDFEFQFGGVFHV